MIVLRLVRFFLDVLFLPLRLVDRWRVSRALPQKTWLTVTINGPVVDVIPRRRWLAALRPRPSGLSLEWLSKLVTESAKRPDVKGLVVTLTSMTAGMASATSLRALLLKARAAGKEVVVVLPRGGDTKDVYVASAADRIFLGPTTQLAPLGFRSASRYLKRALYQAGVEPQVFACGEFKSAGETFVRDTMSPAQRAQVERLLDGFHHALIDAIADGRRVTREQAIALVDEGPHFGQAAVDVGLADGLAYDDEIPSKIDAKREDLVDAAGWLARATRPLVRAVRCKAVLEVITIHGAIAHAGGLFGDLSTDERVTRMVRAARADRRVKGVLLHIDSPGGGVLATDLMHHEIVQLAREKPVVACMANVAASGGYYVAAAAKKIVAEPTTVTGSIGVVAMRISFEPLLAKLGVTTEVIERGARATLTAAMGPLDPAARAVIDQQLEATYRVFVDVVARGRSIPTKDVERLARGRVYTGKDALDVGLVDVLGGFDVAVAELRTLVGDPEIGVRLATTPRAPRPIADLPTTTTLLRALLPRHERAIVEILAGGDAVLALSPISET